MLHLLLSPKALWDRVGHEAPGLDHAAMPEVSPHIAASDQAAPSLRPLTMARKQAANPNPSHVEENAPSEDEYAEAHKGEAEVLSDGQAASDGDEGEDRSPI